MYDTDKNGYLDQVIDDKNKSIDGDNWLQWQWWLIHCIPLWIFWFGEKTNIITGKILESKSMSTRVHQNIKKFLDFYSHLILLIIFGAFASTRPKVVNE